MTSRSSVSSSGSLASWALVALLVLLLTLCASAMVYAQQEEEDDMLQDEERCEQAAMDDEDGVCAPTLSYFPPFAVAAFLVLPHPTTGCVRGGGERAEMFFFHHLCVFPLWVWLSSVHENSK